VIILNTTDCNVLLLLSVLMRGKWKKWLSFYIIAEKDWCVQGLCQKD